MKSAVAVAAFSVAAISLQGCGDSGTTTTTTPAPPDPCALHVETKWECPTSLPKTGFSDMADGDTKMVELANGVMTISGPNNTWSTQLPLDATTCSGSVNFSVPGKPNPPGENLTVALLSSFASESACYSPSNYVLSFSNMTDRGYTPLNQWINPEGTSQAGTNFTCFPSEQASRSHFFVDLHDGDQKVVTTDCSNSSSSTCSLKIQPADEGNWTVNALIHKSNCSGMVDFNVTGKPNPPPNPLLATFRVSRWFNQKIVVDAGDEPMEYFIEFKDNGTQVNQWAEVKNPDVLPTTPAPQANTTTPPAPPANSTTPAPSANTTTATPANTTTPAASANTTTPGVIVV